MGFTANRGSEKGCLPSGGPKWEYLKGLHLKMGFRSAKKYISSSLPQAILQRKSRLDSESAV